MSEPVQDNEKTIGLVAYLTLIGWIIAYVMHGKNKTEHGAFHLRQMLGLMVLSLGVWIINMVIAFANIPFLGWITWLLNLGIMVLWILSFIGAVQGEKKLAPVVGEMFQNWFKSLD
jgi:uncharacterized membrane protein